MSIDVAKKDFETLQSDMTKLSGKVKATLEKQDEEIGKLGKSTLETGAEMRKLDEKWCQIADDHKALQERIDEMAAKMGRVAIAGSGGFELKTPGQLFAGSDQIEAMLKAGAKSSNPVVVEKSFRTMLRDMAIGERLAAKANGELTSAEIGSLVDEMRLDVIINSPTRPTTLLDLIPTVPTSSNAIEWVRQNKRYVYYAELSSQAASGQADIVLGLTSSGYSKARGLGAGHEITLSDGLAQEETVVIDSIDHDTGTITATTNLANTHPIGRSVTANHFNFVPEGEYKPQANGGYELISEAVKTLAVWTPVSRQMLADAPQIQGLIDTDLRVDLQLSLERNVLYGAGGAEEFTGILSDPDINEYLWSSGHALTDEVPGDTELDAIRRSFTVTALNFYPTDAVVLSPEKTEKIDTLKGDDGHYIYANIQVGGGESQVWRVARVESALIGNGTGLGGSFRMGARLYDREQMMMRVAEQHEDFFTRNMMALLVELRAGFARPRPKCFTKITFDNAPA